MSAINLLPWRQVVAAREQRMFFVGFGLTLLVNAFVVGLIYLGVASRAADITANNQRLEHEIKQLDLKLGSMASLQQKRQMLQERVRLIQTLQEKRNVPVFLFNQLPELVPNGVYLKSLSLTSGLIVVEGNTESPQRVAELLRRIERHEKFTAPYLSSLVNNDDQNTKGLSQFTLQFDAYQALASYPAASGGSDEVAPSPTKTVQ